jgi:two-component system sensor histidine kinase QseC
MPSQSSLFRRLMLGFSLVILSVALLGLVYVFVDAKLTQRGRTFSENKWHTGTILLQLTDISADPVRMRVVLDRIESGRARLFRELDYHSRVRVRVWQGGKLLYNSQPALPDHLPETATREEYGWVRWVERDDKHGLVVERQHEVDDEWMLTKWGVNFLLSSPIFSLPLLLIPAWLIIGIGLRPLHSIADTIAKRSDADLTPLPDSKYRELMPLVSAINGLMQRLSVRIAREHDFLTDAAHELKTPLAAIQINAHVLLSRWSADQGDGAGRAAASAEGLRSGVARASHTVHQLLALERTQAEPAIEDLPRPTDVAEFVRERLAAAAHLAVQQNIDIEFVTECEEIVPLHLESMAAAVDNVISNAIKYSPVDARIAVRLERDGDRLRLSVRDEGPGIPPELRQKVFERFFRVPGQRQIGSGLGLAIAERGAARNGGAIELSDGADHSGLTAAIVFRGAEGALAGPAVLTASPRPLCTGPVRSARSDPASRPSAPG